MVAGWNRNSPGPGSREFFTCGITSIHCISRSWRSAATNRLNAVPGVINVARLTSSQEVTQHGSPGDSSDVSTDVSDGSGGAARVVE